MIKNIHIKNFRCFEDFKVEGFERINIIGGKNNSGKTCLLEAIACLSNKANIEAIAKLRSQKLSNLVFTKTKSSEIKINATQEFPDTPFGGAGGFIFSFIGKLAGEKLNPIFNKIELPIHFFSQKSEIPLVDVVKSFDDFDQRLLKASVIQIAQIVDPRIEDIRTFKTKEGLWIKTQLNEYEPLDNYGDAIKNLMRYFTPVFEKELSNSKSLSILLIDEIENGIHYSVHEEFWENMFKLSQKLNVQIFATTHSREMITAFNNVALIQGEGAYFEMARDIDTGEIFAQKHDMSLLQYELEAPKSTFRGE